MTLIIMRGVFWVFANSNYSTRKSTQYDQYLQSNCPYDLQIQTIPKVSSDG